MNRLQNLFQGHKKSSYSQCGEDLIIEFVFQALNIARPSYLDIGAHHPVYLSNTYLFYRKGSSGVCIEPDPSLCRKIRRKRGRDTCLNIGTGVSAQSEAEFYLMTTRTLNTFCREEAERYQSYGSQKIEQVVRIPLLPINDVIMDNFPSCPDFVSLDVEGLDLEILKTFDFDRYRPQVFCIETLTYTEDKTEKKLVEIIDFMTGKGYLNYADTYINTIFVDRRTWLDR